jgi:hypothetical protein
MGVCVLHLNEVLWDFALGLLAGSPSGRQHDDTVIRHAVATSTTAGMQFGIHIDRSAFLDASLRAQVD